MALQVKNPFMAAILLLFFVSSSYASSSSIDFEFEYPSFPNSWVVRMIGDTFINKTTSSVQLTTPDHVSTSDVSSSLISIGTMIYPSPIPFFDHGTKTNKPCSFTTNFSFSISHKNHTFFGKGFYFFIVPTLPSAIAMSVIPDSVPYFMVVFDTNSVGYSSITITLSYFEKFEWKTVRVEDMDLKSGDHFYSWIEYDSSFDFLSVFLSKDMHRPSVPVIVADDLLYSYLRDHTSMDIGFSGHSIQNSEIYSIHSWNFTSEVA